MHLFGFGEAATGISQKTHEVGTVFGLSRAARLNRFEKVFELVGFR